MLKAYLNAVWTYGWAFGPGGEALKDKQLQIVTTAGASEFTYSHEGLLNSTMEEVLTPMKASARYVGMRYRQPLAFYEVAARNKDKLSEFQTRFAAELRAA